jgi:hypothetical protein
MFFFTCVCLFLSFITFVYTGCLKKNGPRYSFAIDNPNEKNYTGNEMTLKALQTGEHIIFYNIYPVMGNGQLLFFK